MSQAVAIKSNKYGINLILDKDMPFGELLEAVAEKFENSANFFKDAKLAISFEGRELTPEQNHQIVDVITTHTDITIICIVDNEQSHTDMIKQQIDTYYDSIVGKDGEFYRGTLRFGQVLESVSSIVIIGNVNLGAKIISQGNIIVLGTLQGNAYAGAAGKKDSFIAALEMDPIQLQIGDVTAKCREKRERRRKSASERKLLWMRIRGLLW